MISASTAQRLTKTERKIQQSISENKIIQILDFINDKIVEVANGGQDTVSISLQVLIDHQWLDELFAFHQFGEHILPTIREAGYMIYPDHIFDEQCFTIEWKMNPAKSE